MEVTEPLLNASNAAADSSECSCGVRALFRWFCKYISRRRYLKACWSRKLAGDKRLRSSNWQSAGHRRSRSWYCRWKRRQNQASDNKATLERAIVSAVLTSSDDCWLTPCGNWKGPTTVTKNFQDLKLTFPAGPPSDAFNIFKQDFSTVVDNIKWILNEVAVGDVKSKGFLNPTNMLRFRHVLFEVMFFSN